MSSFSTTYLFFSVFQSFSFIAVDVGHFEKKFENRRENKFLENSEKVPHVPE
jgi:hypothetical protein